MKAPLLFSSLCLASFANADLLFADSFSDTSGTNLNGKSADVGANWQVSGNGLAQVSSPGLSYADAGYSGLVEAGNAARVNESGTTVASASLTGAQQVVYSSFLFKRENASSYFSYALSIGPASTYVSGIYLNASGQVGVAGYNQPNNTYPEQLTSETIGIGETALLVMRYAFSDSGLESSSVAINPTLGVEDWDATVDFSFAGVPTFAGMYTGSAGSTTYFDELRVGTNLADVTPVPEPATLAALAGAFAGLARRRSRK